MTGSTVRISLLFGETASHSIVYFYPSHALWFLIPAFRLVTNNCEGSEEIPHEQNEEAGTTHPDLTLHESTK